MRGMRTAAFVAALLVFAGCGSSSTTAPGASTAPSSGAASEAPAQSEAPASSESTGPGAVGFVPGTVGLTVGTHGAGFAGVVCQDLGNGLLSVRSGDLNGGEAFALVFRSDGTVSSLSGALRGVVWEVTQNPQGTLRADRSGTFSGKDAIVGADVAGTFAC
jgi:hypothetical protein